MTRAKHSFKEVATPQGRERPDGAKANAHSGKAPPATVAAKPGPRAAARDLPPERGGYDGPEPTRHGDWQHKGRTTDF